MDATYKTNRFNMPLFLISSVNPFGRSYVLACCLMRDERIETYTLVLAAFKLLFEPTKIEVNTIITDQDSSLISAIEAVFPNATHQLCRWHLLANIRKNLATNPSLCSRLSELMSAPTRSSAEDIYAKVLEGASSREASYVARLYGLKEKYVEAWVSCNRNLGIKSTQRAESMNHSIKRLVQNNSPLVNLFQAFVEMTTFSGESYAFEEFQMRDKKRSYHPFLIPLSGQVPQFILSKMHEECLRIDGIVVETMGDDRVTFNDYHTFLLRGECNCSFFVQYAAPCAHMLKMNQERANDFLHSAWKINTTIPMTAPTLSLRPRHETQMSTTDRKFCEFSSLLADLQMDLHEMNIDMAIMFLDKFKEMLQKRSLNSPVTVRDPPIVKSRGRPPKRSKNNFKGISYF